MDSRRAQHMVGRCLPTRDRLQRAEPVFEVVCGQCPRDQPHRVVQLEVLDEMSVIRRVGLQRLNQLTRETGDLCCGGCARVRSHLCRGCPGRDAPQNFVARRPQKFPSSLVQRCARATDLGGVAFAESCRSARRHARLASHTRRRTGGMPRYCAPWKGRARQGRCAAATLPCFLRGGKWEGRYSGCHTMYTRDKPAANRGAGRGDSILSASTRAHCAGRKQRTRVQSSGQCIATRDSYSTLSLWRWLGSQKV